MDPEQHAGTNAEIPICREVIGGPAPRGAVTKDDYLITYGPLGIMAAIFLAIMAVLWRDRNSVRREADATAKRDKDECRAERERSDGVIRELAREANATARAINEKWHDHAKELRGTVESATRRMGRRE